MIPGLKEQIAKLWASQKARTSNKEEQNAIENQQKTLLHLVQTAKNTNFGKDHNFSEIKNIADFQQNVPLGDYENIRAYIEQIKQGENNILWPGKPQYFAKTSGTTSGAKYIPISKEAMPYQIKAAQNALFHYIDKSKNASFVSGKMIFLQGSPALEEQNGIKTGRLSGIVAHHIPSYLQKNRLPSWETNLIEDWEIKVDRIVEETCNQDMRLISGIPPWLIMYFEKLIAKTGKNISTLFPNLQLLITGGVNYQPYESKMLELLGKPIDTIQTYPASEGFFAYQDDYEKDGLLLITNGGIFYEFIAQEDLGKPKPKRLTLEQVELHKDYAIVLSTNAGLWAYEIGDMVRFVNKDPYRILVSGRTKHYTSAFGEHVIAYEVEKALQDTLEKFPAQVSEFHLAPMVSPKQGLPYHEWFFEFEKEPSNIAAFAEQLDKQMQERNSYYKDLVQGGILKPLEIKTLPKKAFEAYAKSQGKLGGQNKLPRLANDRKIADFLEQNFS